MPTRATTPPPNASACLMLADGNVFFGEGIGAYGNTVGEVCFNTAMTGYQEVLTDPSYSGQIITFTFPHIGIVGCNPEDIEAHVPHARGLVLREPITESSNYRADTSFNDWLKKHHMVGICGIDTRALTRRIRLGGAQNVAMCHLKPGESFDFDVLKAALYGAPDMTGMELAKTVTTQADYEWKQRRWKHGVGYSDQSQGRHHIVAIDYGEKLNILRSLAERNCKVTVVPATASAEQILALKPDGIFLSNGPGDPAATGKYAITVLKQLLDARVPMFGICLGHQLMALALGARTQKMKQGHRGANHPVKNLKSGAVEITSQNHGFMVVAESLPANTELTHCSLFDNCVEGFRVTDRPAFAVQYHPESSPGPHDSQYLFDQFIDMIEQAKAKAA